jgi:16S rRNA A1518/A1519 N6-dimethyltransferase RsmA/KsgA/DIM1 with predicted DNA glycosylase/AP lyase activity
MSLIVDSLDLKNNQTVIDLGAGDGIVIFEAASKALGKKLNTQFVAVDINPILILILHLHRFFHPNKKNIEIVRGDFFTLNFSSLTTHYSLLTTIYLYISPWFLDKVSKRILSEFPKAKIVSYMYPIKSLKKKERKIYAKHTIFVYG